MAPRLGAWFSVLALLALPGSITAAPWRPVGPGGSDTRAVAADTNGHLFAGTHSGGVYVSTDDGLNWTPTNGGLPSDPSVGGFQTVNGLTVDGNRLFACTSQGLYLSTNAGVSWQPASTPPGVSLNERRLFVDPDDSLRLMLCIPQSGVFVYEPADSIPAWVKPGGMNPGFPVHELERAPSNSWIYYAVTGGVPRVYRSTDNVHSWVDRGPLPGTKLRDLAVDAANPDRLYVSTDTGAWLSRDGGATFSRMDGGQDPQVYQFVNLDGSVIALARGGILSNQADPDHLQPVRSFPYTRVGAAIRQGTSLFLASDMGVLEGTWSGTGFTGDFVLHGKGMNNVCVTAVAPVPHSDVIYVATGLAFDAGVYRSEDGGVTWEQRATGLTNPDLRCLSVFPGNPDIAYAGTADAIDDTGENGSVFKTTDGGLHWTDVGGTLPFTGGKQILVTQVHPTNPDIVYVSVQGIEGGMFRTTNGGASWSRTSQGLESMPVQPAWCTSPPQCPQWSFWAADFHDYFAMLSLGIDPANPDRIFVGSGGCWGGPYRSGDTGVTWVRRSEGHMEIDSEVQRQIDNVLNEGTAESWFPVHLELYDMDVTPWDPNHVFATGGRGQFDSAELFGIVYASVDGGDTWSIVHENTRTDYFSAPTSGMALHAGRPRELYVSARDGVHVSHDEGVTWSKMNDGLSAAGLQAQNITFDADDANRLYIGTINAGVWVRDLDPVAVRLTHLGATMQGTGVVITWGVADAVNHVGFYIDRDVNGTRDRLTASLLSGREEYTYVDHAPVPGAVNRYWVVELSRTGDETRYGPMDVAVNGFERFRVGPAVPNPLRTETRLALSGNPPAVRVIDASGRRVATVVVPGGANEIVWKAVDDRGQRVPAGVYFIQVDLGATRLARRVLVLP